jgi:hypothetical protein
MKSKILISIVTAGIISCSEVKKEKEIWPPQKNKTITWEYTVNSNDTINMIKYGYKQGKWILIDSAKLRSPKHERVILDTVYYRNDTIAEK